MLAKRQTFAMLPLVLGLLVGCGGPKEPVPVTVTGTVQMGGKPLESGTITFAAPDGKPPAQGKITSGAYSLQSLPGERRVEIRNYVEVTNKKGPAGEQLTRDTIPLKYNNNSTLKATVTETGPNSFDFKLDAR